MKINWDFECLFYKEGLALKYLRRDLSFLIMIMREIYSIVIVLLPILLWSSCYKSCREYV